MTRKSFWFTFTAALLIAAVVGLRPAFAATYHIGTGQQYADLTALRNVVGATLNNDTLIFHSSINDSLSPQGSQNGTMFNVTGTVNVFSNVQGEARTISAITSTSQLRLFDIGANAVLNISKDFTISGFNPLGGGVINVSRVGSAINGTLNAEGVTFIDNSTLPASSSTIDSGRAKMINVRDARFENNIGGRGAIEVYNVDAADLTNTTFLNNTSTAEPGGAITVIGFGNTTNITMGATAENVSLYEGNKYTNSTENPGISSSLHWYGSGTLNLNIVTEETGILDLKDPFTMTRNGSESTNNAVYTTTITKSGLGTWKLGGNSVIDGAREAIVRIQEGTLELYRDASLDITRESDWLNNYFYVGQNAKLQINGNNEISAGGVYFVPGSTLSFDASYYFPENSTSTENDGMPMLRLDGDILIDGTRIDVNGIPNDNRRNGDYILIQGTSALEIGDFNLYISGTNIDVSGRVSDRFGYALGYGHDAKGKENNTQFVLSIQDTDNTVLRWNNLTPNGQWSVVGENWTLIRDDSVDSFIPGDTVQFFDSGTHTINLFEDVTIGPDSKHVYYNANDNTGMHVSGNGNWTFNGDGSITDSTLTGAAALFFDGSGTLTLANSKANTYSGGTNLGGTGTLNVSRSDLLGTGSINFVRQAPGTSADQKSRLNFTGVGDTVVGQQIVAESGGNGLITIGNSKNLIIQHTADDTKTNDSAVYVKSGGKLILQANPVGKNGNISFEGNGTKSSGDITDTVSAVYIENGGEFTASKTTFKNNQVENGGIIYNEGTATILDSTFTNNIIEGTGGVAYSKGTLTIGATEGKTTSFSGNKDLNGEQANSVYLTGGGAVLIVDTQLNGVVDMLDPMASGGNSQTTVTKTGEGTWKLAGINQFQSTAFEIQGGSVDLYKADADKKIKASEILINNGTFTINDGGTLNSQDGNRIEASTFTINAGGTLNSRGRNFIKASTVNLDDGAILGFDLSASSAGDGIALLTMDAGSWNSGSGQQIIDILELSTKSNYGVFDLIDVTGTLNVNNMQLLYHGEDMTKLRQRVGNLNFDGNTVQLQILHSTQNGVTQWTDKTQNGVWDGTSSNWDGKSPDILGAAQFLQGDAVVFTNEGSGTITIIDGGVKIAPQGGEPGMTVNNFQTQNANNELVSHDYIFTGGSISGSGGLLKQGNGTVTFTQENSFTGGATIEDGKVVANTASSLGTGNVLVYQNAVLEFDFNGQNSGVFEQKISGGGQLVKSGGGSLTLTKQNEYVGGTTVLGGVLIADGLDALGTGDIVTGIEGHSGMIVFKLTENGTYSNIISGTGSIKTEGNGQLTLAAVNSYSGGTVIGNGSTVIASNISATGTGNIENNGKLVFDVAAGGTFQQSISGSGELEKKGTGVLELNRANTFSGKTTLSAGTLRLNRELALQNSVLDFQGGKLEFGTQERFTLGGLNGTQSFSLTNSGDKQIGLTIGTDNEGSDTPDFSGNLTGSGSVTKIGSGTQILSGKNTYSGGTRISAGRLVSVGTSGFGSGNVINNSEMEFKILAGQDVSYKNYITGTGSLWKTDTGTLRLFDTNHYTGGTFIDDGQLIVSKAGSLGSGDISLRKGTASLSFDITGDAAVSQNINGIGSVLKNGTGTLIFEKDINTTGTFDVHAGSAFVNANSKAETTVYHGATLGGRGTIDNNVTFLNGSSHVVGANQDGMLVQFTAKNIAYENGSTVYIKIGMNDSDQIVAKEGINFAQGGGVVKVMLLNFGDFNPDATTSPKEYEVFTADNGKLQLDGVRISSTESGSNRLTVEGVDGEVQFLAAPDEDLDVLGYSVKTSGSGRGITLNLAATGPGAVAYLSGDQQAILKGVGDAQIFDGLYSCNREYRGSVINQTMPMIQTAMPYITQRSITQFNIATFERLRFLREPLALTDQEVNAYRGSSYRLAHLHSKTNYLWFQNYGDFMRMNAHGGVPEFQADAYGYTFGVDRGIDYHSSVGLGMGGYSSSVKANSVYQSADVDSFLISLYSNWVNDDNWMLTSSAGVVFSSYDLERKVPLFSTTLNSRHSGMTAFFSLEGSKKLLFGKYEVSPYLGIDFIGFGEDGYVEHANGLSSLALNVKKNDAFSVLSSAGVRLGRSMRLLGGNIVSPSVYAAWVHDWTEGGISSTASFLGESTIFKIRGASMNRDRAQAGTNVNMTLNKRTDMFARFNAEVADHYSNLSFHLGFRVGY